MRMRARLGGASNINLIANKQNVDAAAAEGAAGEGSHGAEPEQATAGRAGAYSLLASSAVLKVQCIPAEAWEHSCLL